MGPSTFLSRYGAIWLEKFFSQSLFETNMSDVDKIQSPWVLPRLIKGAFSDCNTPWHWLIKRHCLTQIFLQLVSRENEDNNSLCSGLTRGWIQPTEAIAEANLSPQCCNSRSLYYPPVSLDEVMGLLKVRFQIYSVIQKWFRRINDKRKEWIMYIKYHQYW